MSGTGMRWQVRVDRPIAYDVIKAPGLFDPANEALMAFGRPRGRRFVVVDGEVARHHGSAIRGYFTQRGVDARIVVFPGGEEHKSVEIWQDILRALDAFPIHRRDEPIIAIGGGVLTDVVAFVAASYRRSVPHLKVPTTLMGYVDAALGIKAGINFNGNKNRLGSFEPPQAVLLDKSLLVTLPRRHLLNGMCEIIKLAIIRDGVLFETLELHGAASVAAHFANPTGDLILDRAIGGMLDELTPNLYEEELARKVDFGHSFSYGLETRHEQRLLHGEAVLLDILVSTMIAERRQLLRATEAARIFALVAALGIELDYGVLDGEVMWHSLLDRIEHRNGLQRVPLPAGLGHCTFANDITRAELDGALRALHTRLKDSHEPALER
ncbi:MAG: sedoheptulose 7-phosphate cyclase [Dokdonella sp.]|uniref:sedoheptulose 7-phosphate cyclase n=1 Tax=Dokdonella sp. TaxID=2291710 RepID=UPI0025BEB047|nr:sedoheptulose 7-phosphate cyclase [Dokdonella sp.]MBX3699963.1 sedoheptulose 7-phosphate cyclase [Dokdonella sp.]